MTPLRGTLLLALFAGLLPAVPSFAAPKEAKFPLSEQEIGFGKTLADFGIKDTRVVHAKDFGWNPANATKAVQKALDSKATTVVIDRMASPWYVESLKVRSRQRILFKKGVQMFRVRDAADFKRKAMFDVSDTENVILEGEGMTEVMLASYDEPDGVRKNCRAEGASIIRLSKTKNTVLRGFKAARSEQDGIALGGDMFVPPLDTWIEDVDLVGNYRQGMSLVVAKGVYCRNARFRWTNAGGSPMIGLDLEPVYPVNYNTDVYLFDCFFEGNNGGGIVFANHSKYPIRSFLKRCHFAPGPSLAITIAPLGEYYIPRGEKADAKLVFEDCLIERGWNVPAIRFGTAPLFDCTFRRVVIKDTGKPDWMNAHRHESPIDFVLDRDFTKAGKGFTPKMLGVAEFIDCEATGFSGPVIAIKDCLGMQSLEGAFKGKIKYNGKNVDVSQFNYRATDLGEPQLAITPVKEFQKVERVQREKLLKTLEKGTPPGNFKVAWGGRWYHAPPAYTYYFWGEKGKKVSFTLKYWKKTRWGAELEPLLKGKHVTIDTGAGQVSLGGVHTGDNRFEFTPAKSGWCAMHPPMQNGDNGNWVRVEDVSGTVFAFLGDTLSNSMAKLEPLDEKEEIVVYFEVPPKGDCHVRINAGTFELREPSGHVAASCKSSEYAGRYDFRFKSKSGKGEVWSLRSPPGAGRREFRMYQPLTGIWAPAPELLPRKWK